MKLDPDMHIGMHLVCFTKTRCDSWLRVLLLGGTTYLGCLQLVTMAVFSASSFGDLLSRHEDRDLSVSYGISYQVDMVRVCCQFVLLQI
jgi:hypothetical protein